MRSTASILKDSARQLKYRDVQGRHFFVEHKAIHGRITINKVLRTATNSNMYISKLYLDNKETDEDIDTFLTLLFRHIRTYAKKQVTNGKAIALEELRIMLPYDYPETLYHNFVEDIMATYFTGSRGVAPYFYVSECKSDVTYVRLFICNRYYYPDGTIEDIVATHDNYRNAINGRTCSADDPLAVLAWKKGTVLKQREVYFLGNEMYFNMHQKKFDNFIINIKKILQKHYDAWDSEPENDAYFSRIDFDDFSPYMKKMCYAYNTMMITMEAKCTGLIYNLRQAGFNEYLPRVRQFIAVWRDKVLHPIITLKFGKIKFDCKICLRYPLPLEKLEKKIVTISDAFDIAFNSLTDKIWTKQNIFGSFA